MKRFSMLFVILVIGVVLGFQSTSHATLTLYLSDNAGHTATVIDTNADGAVSWAGSLGGWNINTSAATAPPWTGTFARPEMDLTGQFKYTGTPAGTLTILASEVGFGPATGNVSFFGSVSATIPSNMIGNFSWFFDKNNNLPATGGQQLASSSIGPPGGFDSGNAIGTNANGPYSLSLEAEFPATGGSDQTASFNQNIRVPEPTTLILLGSGLAALGIWARRRFRK